MGRLKPGVTAAQVQGNLERVFQNTARAGLDAYLKGLPESGRNTVNNRNRTEVPYLTVDSAGAASTTSTPTTCAPPRS